MKGVVLRHDGSTVAVDLGGEEVACTVPKALRRAAGKGKAVVVGDRVEVERTSSGASIVSVEPRDTVVSRPDPGDARRELVVVANVDTVLVVTSARDPDLAPGLIDRFLIAAESRGLVVGLAINKIDLDAEKAYGPVAGVYRDLGYPVLETSSATGEGIPAVREFLANRTTTMLGHSGVGKSSLANALDPSLRLRTAEVHAATRKGVHTTTTVSLLRLPWGGYLVDTPGIREFGLWNMEPSDLGVWFREFAKQLDQCRFNDCLHDTEPGCAVKAAVRSGTIPQWRHDSYLRILRSIGSDYGS
jgi:ribosome biogenesis GTPase